MNLTLYSDLQNEIVRAGARLVAVSKNRPIEDILSLYTEGHRLFAENKPQELVAKYHALPKDIEWHLIGHLQTNKVKSIAPFVHIIESVDSLRLLETIDREAAKCNRVINVLLQLHIAQEPDKTGFTADEIRNMPITKFTNISINGLMAIATNTSDITIIRSEFSKISSLFHELRNQSGANFKELSIGMSSDYRVALEFSPTIVRIGSLLFN